MLSESVLTDKMSAAIASIFVCKGPSPSFALLRPPPPPTPLVGLQPGIDDTRTGNKKHNKFRVE